MGKTVRSTSITPGGKHILMSLGVLLLVLIVGTTGYMWIENLDFTRALYMTVITISTVGFREVTRLSHAGMYFTICIIAVGVSAMLFFVSAVLEYILSELFGIWGRRRMDNKISKLANHYIVCGYGRVGRSVAEELKLQGKEFVAVEKDPDVFQKCIDDGFLGINGSATDNEVLVKAGVEDAEGLVSALSSDADNVYVILSARMKNPGLFLVARTDEPESEEKMIHVGADRVISPHVMAGKRMANLLTRPRICEFVDVWIGGGIPEYQLTEFKIDKGSGLIGAAIKDTRLRERVGVTILGIRKTGDVAFNANPEPDIVIEENDFLILAGTSDQMKRMQEQQL